MSRLRHNDESAIESGIVLVISDSENSSSSSQPKRLAGNAKQSAKINPSSSKKPKIDAEPTEEPIDIDSVYTNPIRTQRKVSSDTSSKFPVSSPSDTVPLAGHRKKYLKNTLPAGAFERLQEIAHGHPPITYKEKLANWICCDELSDVEDVNNFDDNFQKREKLYIKNSSGRRSAGKDSIYPNYNYHHFRSVILENLKGSPVPSQDSTNKSLAQQPSCSKEVTNKAKARSPIRPEPRNVTIYEKLLCPSSDSNATKASPSIRLHWTDEESVFRCNRLNPDIDKCSQLIKIRIDYNKEINLKAKINEIFKTPTVPTKYFALPESRKSLDASSCETKSVEDHPPQENVEANIESRRSTGGKSAESRQSLERKNSDRRKSTERWSSERKSEPRSSDRFPEVDSFQQDEFCNYLGLGMNGKVYSPTPTDNKRRSLRVKRLLQQSEIVDKKSEKKKEVKKRKIIVDEQEEKEKEEEPEEVTTTTAVNDNRCSNTSPLTVKCMEEKQPPEEPIATKFPAPIQETNTVNKNPEIKIITQLRNNAIPLKLGNTPSSVTTANSTPPPTTRRLRRTRATSNGTSTCPRSSQSDESPSKAAPRRRRLNQHGHRNNHRSDLSESIQSDPPQPNENGPPGPNGRISTIPSSEGKKDEYIDDSHVEVHADKTENVHEKYRRYLEESRKTKPSIFIVDSINTLGCKTLNFTKNNSNTADPKENSPKENQSHKSKQRPAMRKTVFRRLFQRNKTIIGAFNQRILRKRTVTKQPRINASKSHPRQDLKKKTIRMQMAQVRLKKQPQSKKTETTPGKQSSQGISQENSMDIFEEVQTPLIKNISKNTKKVQCSLPEIDPLSIEKSDEKTTSDAEIQTEPCAPPLPISFLTTPSSRMPNPLTPEKGRVIYAYYELDILTIVQDFMVTFWKTSKLIQVLENSPEEWFYLGECKRLLSDTEIKAPYKNRICVHNSIPIYVEMRAKELSKQNRDCDLISVYINVYYYHDEELVAKSHSIQLDTVPSRPENVVYTTITDSRYFVMCWSQEMMCGKSLSGLCKYSLTPHLDTLASIREFKSMRHEIRYLECTTDDNLIGFGDSQVTLWDHRSGDILMNYDLDIKIGINIGSLHFAPLEVGHAKTVLIFQKTSAQELLIIAINVSHNAPSHQLVCKHILPAEFENLESSTGIDDYTILTNTEHQELWIDHSDPQYLMHIKTPEGQSRFYSHCKQNVIVITENHLALETFSSFVLKMINNTAAAD